MSAAMSDKPTIIMFDIYNPGDESVGIFPFSEIVRITVKHGIPEDEQLDFVGAMEQALKDYYDTPSVTFSSVWDGKVEDLLAEQHREILNLKERLSETEYDLKMARMPEDDL